MTQRTDDRTHPEFRPWFTHKKLPLLFAAVAFAVLMWASSIPDGIEISKLAAKLTNMALVTIAGTLFSVLWNSSRTDTDARIYADPIATALLMGGVWLAYAVSIAGF